MTRIPQRSFIPPRSPTYPRPRAYPRERRRRQIDPPPAWCDARTGARGSHVGGWHAPACRGRARAAVDARAAEEGGEEGLAVCDEASASDTAVADTAARHHIGLAIEEADPVADAVEKKVEAALLRLHFHDAPAALANALALEALPAHKVLVLVDASVVDQFKCHFLCFFFEKKIKLNLFLTLV